MYKNVPLACKVYVYVYWVYLAVPKSVNFNSLFVIKILSGFIS